MSSEIYIAFAKFVPNALKSDLREDRSMHQLLHGDIGDGEECLVLRLGVRRATNPLPQDVPKEIEALFIESLTPKYTIFMRSREAFEQLDDSIPIHMPGSSSGFDHMEDLKERIKQTEEVGYRIMYETEADTIEKFLQGEKVTQS